MMNIKESRTLQCLTLLGLLALSGSAARAANPESAPDAGQRLAAAVDASQPAPAAPPDLAGLLREAFANSPRVAAARAAWQAAIEKYPQARSLPDPMIGLMREENEIQTRVAQMFPAPGTLRLKGDMAHAQADMARLDYEMAVRDLVTDVRTSYAELQYLDRAIELTQQNQGLVDRLVSMAQKDYGEGKAPLNDLMRTQAQQAQVGYDLLLLQELRQTQATRMNTLLNRAPETPVAVAPQQPVAAPVLNLDALYALAEQHRPEILIAAIGETMGGIQIGMARKMARPDYTVMVSRKAMKVDSGMGGSGTQDTWGISLDISVPIWAARNKAAVREAEHNLDAAQASRQQSVNQSQEQIKSLYFKISTSGRLVDLYEQNLVPQARQSLEQSETWYNAGKASLSELIEVQAVWLNFELALARSRADLTQNLAMLEMTVGASFDTLPGGGAQ